VWTYTLATDVFCSCCTRTDDQVRRRGRFIAWLTACCWSIALRICFWIRLEDSGLKRLQEAGTRGRQVFMAINHVSWLDTPLVCAHMPDHLIGDAKTLMAKLHLGLPILGRLAQAIGHMPVPFLSNKSFNVDKQKLAKTMDRLNAHLAAGGHLAIFPEGDLNAKWHTLLPFRAGSLELCIRYDMEVWGWVFAGTADCWPSTVALGGSPAAIRTSAAMLYASAKAAAQNLAGPDADLRTQAVALAGDMRSRMQRSLDELRGIVPSEEGGAAEPEGEAFLRKGP